MESGTYGPGNTKFEKLTVKRFPIHLFDSYLYGKAGCGATALGLITGVSPLEIAAKRNSGHYSDRFMVDFLRKHKISAYKVNKANISNKKIWTHSIKDNNVLLYSSLIQKAESTWTISCFGTVYHNFEILKASYFDMLNFPVDSCFVLYKSEWAL